MVPSGSNSSNSSPGSESSAITKKQVDTVKNWFTSSDQGRIEALIREMLRDPEAPVEAYGGSRDNVRLTSIAEAKRYIVDHGGELPWGLRDSENSK